MIAYVVDGHKTTHCHLFGSTPQKSRLDDLGMNDFFGAGRPRSAALRRPLGPGGQSSVAALTLT